MVPDFFLCQMISLHFIFYFLLVIEFDIDIENMTNTLI